MTTTVEFEHCTACNDGQKHSPEKILFSDGNNDKWFAKNNQKAWVTFDFDEYKDITGFGFVSANNKVNADPVTARVQIMRNGDWFDIATFEDLKTEWDGDRRTEIKRDLSRTWRAKELRIQFSNEGETPDKGIQLETVKFYGYE